MNLRVTVALCALVLAALHGFLPKQQNAIDIRNISASSTAKLPVLGDAPSFTLIDQDSEEFSTSDLAGKIYVSHFFFTSCMGPCPAVIANVALLYNELAERDDVQLLSISNDPRRDSPEKLKAYAAKLGADHNRWHFLRGDIEKIHAIAEQGYKVATSADVNMHSTKLFLVDGEGKLRGYYSGAEKGSVSKILKAIEAL